MSVVGLVVHGDRSEAADLAHAAADWLKAQGHVVRLPAADGARPELAGIEDPPPVDRPAPRFATGLDVVVSIGGDGTMLRSVDMVAADEVPVIGINVGQLGYLTEVDPQYWQAALERWVDGDTGIDERMLLDVQVDRIDAGAAALRTVALNEAVLEKTPMGHTVRMEVFLDDHFFTTYAADGLIVATPTGSTAYSFSARGPIVAPRHRAILLTPVSPHMLFDRTMVLEPTGRVRLSVCGPRPATLSVDGRTLGQLRPGDSVVCSAAPHSARFVTFGDRDFHQIVKAKFGLEDR